jgi:hypothetical protein
LCGVGPVCEGEMRKVNLTESDLRLLNHAISIIQSDYDGGMDYSKKMMKKLENLSFKVSSLLDQKRIENAAKKKRSEASKKIKSMLKAFRNMK